jgi:hypothetical protein
MTQARRLLLVGAASVWLCAGLVACGGTHRDAAPITHSSPATDESSLTETASASTASTTGAPREDRDKDYGDGDGDGYFDHDDYDTVNYPQTADATDTQAVTALVKRYFKAAAAADGATGCSLIYSLFAETIPETLGLPPSGTPSLYGKTCAVVMTKLFKQNHRRLVAETATLQVAAVRVNRMRGFALLHFNGIPAQSIQLHLERGVWKINETLAVEVS